MRLAARLVLYTLLGLAVVLVGGWYVLRRPDIPYAALEAKYAGPTDRYLDLPSGVRVHYRDEGARGAPVLVLVHGWSASLRDWRDWVDRLGGEYRIVTLDLPGHGLTRAPAGYGPSLGAYAGVVGALADALDLGRFVLVGNSMGGAVAWTYALGHADRVRALVLVDSAGWPGPTAAADPPLIFRILSTRIGRWLLRDLDATSMTRDGLRAAMVDRSLVTPALVDRYLDFARAPGHRDILLAMREMSAQSPRTFAALEAQTLVLWGREDRVIPLADGEHLAGAIPGARMIVYDGVGHLPMQQIPDRSAADLRAFLHNSR